jgi:hypothetical protein
VPRRAETTPLEHERALAGQIGGTGANADLGRLTGGYNVARYGAEPATAEEEAAVRDAWRRLQSGRG